MALKEQGDTKSSPNSGIEYRAVSKSSFDTYMNFEKFRQFEMREGRQITAYPNICDLIYETYAWSEHFSA